MFYVIERKYVGPNQDQYADADTVGIYTTPGRANMSKEVRLSGWLGTTNDWSEYAHGEYLTKEAAEAAIRGMWEHVRDSCPSGEGFYLDDNCVALFKPGCYEAMGHQATADWCWQGVEADITASTSDEQIAQLVKEYEETANSFGYTLCLGAAEESMRRRRQELQEDED